jgi:anthranilate phosphoribosyltransferase
VLADLIRQLQEQESLTETQVGQAIEALTAEHVPAELKADFLTALAEKGETVEEIAGFARRLRERAVRPILDDDTRARTVTDVCGTGGDRLNTFNISTTVALLLAAAKVPVAKHGNRAITSQCGSADVLEALGLPVELGPEEAAGWLRELNFAFFFAPKYHPAFQHIGPARKICSARGQRTIFNFLGPLLNPAYPAAQLIGVPRPEWCEPLARVLQSLGIRRGMVVCGKIRLAHLDELSTLGPNTIAQFEASEGVLVAEKNNAGFPLQPATLTDLKGGTAADNALLVRRLLAGQERGPKRDAVLLNAAAALVVAGKVRALTEGWKLAGELIDSGRAQATLDTLRDAARATKVAGKSF